MIYYNQKYESVAIMKIICDENTKRETIIKVMRHIMIDNNIKNTDVAEKLGMSKQTVSNLLNPTYRPDSSMTIDTLFMMCQAMGCQLTIDIVPMPRDDTIGDD